MALVSPGVQVTVIDESFYTPAEPGTTPLIVVATAQNKTNAAGTGTAAATTAANIGVAYRLTSQKDLVDLFGVPFFEKTASNSPIHGSERNEYGLLAAYSLLGVTNSVFMVRANVNLNELAGASAAPGSEPADGQWWIDTRNTTWGIQEWNSSQVSPTNRLGQKFTAKTPIVLTAEDSTRIENNKPKESVGAIGDYAVVYEILNDTDSAKIFYKSAGGGLGATFVQEGQWVLVGSPDWIASHPAASGNKTVSTLTEGHTFFLNSNLIAVPGGANVSARLTALEDRINVTLAQQNYGISARVFGGRIYLYSDGSTIISGSDSTVSTALKGAIVLEAGTGTVIDDLGLVAGTYLPPKLALAPHTQVPPFKRSDSDSVQGVPTGSVWVKTTEPNAGARWRISRWNSAISSWVPFDAPIHTSNHAALFGLDRAGGGKNLPTNTLYVQANSQEYSLSADATRDITLPEAQFRVLRRAATERTVIVSNTITNSIVDERNYEFTIRESIVGSAALSDATTITFQGKSSPELSGEEIAKQINAAGLANVVAEFDSTVNRVSIIHKTAGDIRFTEVLNNPIRILFSSSTTNFYEAPEGATTINCGIPCYRYSPIRRSKRWPTLV